MQGTHRGFSLHSGEWPQEGGAEDQEGRGQGWKDRRDEGLGDNVDLGDSQGWVESSFPCGWRAPYLPVPGPCTRRAPCIALFAITCNFSFGV